MFSGGQFLCNTITSVTNKTVTRKPVNLDDLWVRWGLGHLPSFFFCWAADVEPARVPVSRRQWAGATEYWRQGSELSAASSESMHCLFLLQSFSLCLTCLPTCTHVVLFLSSLFIPCVLMFTSIFHLLCLSYLQARLFFVYVYVWMHKSAHSQACACMGGHAYVQACTFTCVCGWWARVSNFLSCRYDYITDFVFTEVTVHFPCRESLRNFMRKAASLLHVFPPFSSPWRLSCDFCLIAKWVRHLMGGGFA